MSVNVTLLAVMGVLFACGIYLLLERSLTRVLLGILLIGNGANVLLLATAGGAGRAPLYEEGVPAGEYADALPQALILTAIVITFAVTAFVLAIIYRSWVIARRDEVVDDVEDRRVAEQPTFDAEEDEPIEADTTEFTDDSAPVPARAGAAARASGPEARAHEEERAGSRDDRRNKEARNP